MLGKSGDRDVSLAFRMWAQWEQDPMAREVDDPQREGREGGRVLGGGGGGGERERERESPKLNRNQALN